MGFFKGSQNNKKDVKSIFQQPFHGHQRCQIIRSITLPVTGTRRFQDARRFKKDPEAHCIIRQLIDIPPTVDRSSADI